MEPFAPGRICNLQPKQPPEEFDQWVLFFAFIVMFVLLIFMGWQLTPTLVSDFKIANAQKVTASDVTIEAASCDTKLFVISSCEFKMRVKGASDIVEQHYLLVGRLGGKPITVLRAKSAPNVLTTNIGMDYLTNRIISYVVFMGLFVALVFGGLIVMILGRGGKDEQAEGI